MQTIKNLFGFSSSVRSEIMKLINLRVKQAEASYNDGVEAIDEKLSDDIDTLTLAAETDKQLLVETLVKEVIGDLLK